MLHVILTAAAPTDRAALRAPPPTAAKPRGTPWRAAHTNAASGPPAPRLVPIAAYAGDSPVGCELAAHAPGLCAPVIRPSQGAPRPSPVAPFKPSRIDPLNREPAAKLRTTAPFKPSRIDPLNREPPTKPGSTSRSNHSVLIP